MKHQHAVQALFDRRIAASTRPFRARGSEVTRCLNCRIDRRYCICALRPETDSDAGFALIYYDDEVLKPSNTGRLIADLIPDTYAFLWQRTNVEPELLSLLADVSWQPIIVFPETHVQAGRTVLRDKVTLPSSKRPLFVLFDGTWREARKMFRKSPYLDRFPVLSISPESHSDFTVRKASRDYQLATAEVASCVLDTLGEPDNARLLKTWFDVFSFRYQQGVTRSNLGDPSAEVRLQQLKQGRHSL